MKIFVCSAISAVALSGVLTGCAEGYEESTCAPQAMGPAVDLQSHEFPLGPGGGSSSSSSSSGGGGARGGSSSSSTSGGSRGGSSSTTGGSRSGGSSSTSGGGYTPRIPASSPNRSYQPPAGRPAPTYVRQPDGMWMPFIGGVVVDDAWYDEWSVQ